MSRRSLAAGLALAGLLALWLTTRSRGPGLLWDRFGFLAFVFDLAASWAVLGALAVWLPRAGARRRLLAFAGATFTLAVCVAIAELPAVFGHDYSVTFRLDPESTLRQLQARVNQSDPELIHVHWPHASFDGEVVGNLTHFGVPNPQPYRVRLRYDAHGFRNATDLARADVVAIGDSFVEAVLLQQGETVSERLARGLGSPVANLGQSGYGFRQELVVLRRFGLPLKPRVVIWFLFGGNDFRDVESYEQMRARFGELAEAPPFRQRSFTRSALFALSRATMPQRFSDQALRHLAYFRGADGARDAVIFGQATEHPSEHQWQVGVEALVEASDSTRDAGAEFLLVYIPRKFEVYQGLLEIPEGSFVADWRDAKLNERVAAWAASRGIAFLDTTPPLRREAQAGSHPYLLDDVHWNARGHELAADAIGDWLRSRGLGSGSVQAR